MLAASGPAPAAAAPLGTACPTAWRRVGRREGPANTALPWKHLVNKKLQIFMASIRFPPNFLVVVSESCSPSLELAFACIFFPSVFNFQQLQLPNSFFFFLPLGFHPFLNINGGAGISFPLLAERLLEVMDDPRRDFGFLG